MEIIKEGNKNKKDIRKKKCGNCKCIFAYDKEEDVANGVYSSFAIVYKYVKCPECHTKLSISIFDKRINKHKRGN